MQFFLELLKLWQIIKLNARYLENKTKLRMSFRNYSFISRTIGEHDNNYTTEVVVVIIPFNGVCKLMHEWKGCNQCWNQHLINKISFCLRQFENQWPLFSWTSRISRPICFVSSCLLESLDLFIICFTVICIRLPKIHLLPYHLLSILIINKIHLLPYLLSILIINKNTSTALSTLDSYHQ